MTSNVLEVEGLSTWFATENGDKCVVEDVTFSIGEGEVFGLVGESGSGKSVTSRSIIRLLASIFHGLGFVLDRGVVVSCCR
ncbi:ATP-binding cassette domain-containing protein [Brevibacterium moorei]|uniref:ATP-binding cassette domain-containing protein n=1 Tax=Brevibacterium moorei TaxID=2968457 RepID=UPI00359CAFE7